MKFSEDSRGLNALHWAALNGHHSTVRRSGNKKQSWHLECYGKEKAKAEAGGEGEGE